MVLERDLAKYKTDLRRKKEKGDELTFSLYILSFLYKYNY